MRYATIDPEKQRVRVIEAETLDAAMVSAGLGDVGHDHGLVGNHIGIFVYEYGLYEPPERQHYFAIGRKLFAGKALLYRYGIRGETINLTECPEPQFFASVAAIEAAIAAGKIDRPETSINGKVTWQWNIANNSQA